MASASTEIRITGSTAFRNATVNAIENILQPGYVWGAIGNGGSGANQQVFVGTTVAPSNLPVVIKTSWSGSAGGIYTLAVPGATAGQPYLADPVGTLPGPVTVDSVTLTTTGTTTTALSTSDQTDTTSGADVALSDAYVATTPFVGGANHPLTDQIVGIVPFEFVKGAYTPDGGTTNFAGGYPGVTNISTPQAQELIDGGLSLNQLTGVPADNAVFVGCVGRDHDSGTRIGAIYDTQTGNFSSNILQYIANGATVGATQFAPQSAGTGVISTLSNWPLETVLGESRGAPNPAPGQEGFFTGGNVKTTLNRDCDTSQGNYIISYLGMSDANGVNPVATGYSYTDGASHTATVTPSQNALTLDGVYPGTATHPFGPDDNLFGTSGASAINGYANIIQGAYNFWGYEHFLYLASLPAGNTKTVANQLEVQLKSEADFGGVGILLKAMNSSRAADGAPITSP
jgi:hypothetical protein